MRGLLLSADDLLRGRGAFDAGLPGHPARPWWLLPALVLVFSPIYGAAMGSYALESPQRLLQVLYSAVKVPLLLGATGLICLPGFVVLSTILGLRDDLKRSLTAILAGQAALSLALASLAPLTRLFYFSSEAYNGAQLFNALMFAAATLAAQVVIRRAYRPLIAANPRHRVMLGVWGAMYVFVGIQMGWTLRPFIGVPGAATTFFRQEPFTNAYVVVAQLIRSIF